MTWDCLKLSSQNVFLYGHVHTTFNWEFEHQNIWQKWRSTSWSFEVAWQSSWEQKQKPQLGPVFFCRFCPWWHLILKWKKKIKSYVSVSYVFSDQSFGYHHLSHLMKLTVSFDNFWIINFEGRFCDVVFESRILKCKDSTILSPADLKAIGQQGAEKKASWNKKRALYFTQKLGELETDRLWMLGWSMI